MGDFLTILRGETTWGDIGGCAWGESDSVRPSALGGVSDGVVEVEGDEARDGTGIVIVVTSCAARELAREGDGVELARADDLFVITARLSFPWNRTSCPRKRPMIPSQSPCFQSESALQRGRAAHSPDTLRLRQESATKP